jgi:peptidase E
LKQIVPLGGGTFRRPRANDRLNAWLLGLTGKPRPRVLLLASATGEHPRYVAQFFRAFRRHRCTPTHLDLFRRTVADLRSAILAQDLIYVGGGNTANLLVVWRRHGVDRILREAWDRGIVLCGPSAGGICWFQAGVTDSFGLDLQPLHGGLGFLPGSFCPHYDSEAQRRPTFRRLVGKKLLPAGYAADDGVALRFEGRRLADIVAIRAGVSAWRVDRAGGQPRETPLPARVLPPTPR